MDMTETPAGPVAPKPKRKAVRRKRAAPAAAAATPKQLPAELAGLTPINCCDDCGPDKCVISGNAICAHPFKGGLQSSMMSDHGAMKRHGAAKKALAHLKIEVGTG